MQGDTAKYNGRTYKGGQVIFVGDDPILKTVCANKVKLLWSNLLSTEKYLEERTKDVIWQE